MQTPIQYFAPQLQSVVTLIWFALYLVALGGLVFAHGLSWIFWVARYRFLLIILLLGVVASVAWSIEPNVSMQRTVHLLGSSVIAIYLGFMIPLTSILNAFSWALGAILVLSVAVVFAIPVLGIEEYGGQRVWRGITTSKNTLGFWSAVGVLLYYSQMAKPVSFIIRLVYFVLAMFALFILYKTNSATSILALMVGGLVSLYFFIAIRFRLGIVRMGVMAALFSVVIALAIANTETSELIGRSGDLTGRSEVWSQTWNLILKQPLTGYGYGSIWNPNDSTLWIQQSLTDFTWTVFHAHNGFLQIASEIGLPLSVLALLMVIQQLIEIFYCQYDRQQIGVLFVLGFVVAYLVSNYSEARFLVNRELYWIFFIALPISMLRQVDVVLPTAEIPDSQETDDALVPLSAHAVTQEGTVALDDDEMPENKTDDLDNLFEQDHQKMPNDESDEFDQFQVANIDLTGDDSEIDKFDQFEGFDDTDPSISVDIDLDPDKQRGKK